MGNKESITGYMGNYLRQVFQAVPDVFFEEVEEIRLRVEKPVILLHKGKEFFITPGGKLMRNMQLGYKPSADDLNGVLTLISDYSMYAFEEEVRNGYLTLPGGHRIGLTGKTVVDGDSVKTIRNINGLNIRLSHEAKGCADGVMPYIFADGLHHTMVISPPGCGKTTLLRDIIRQISDGVLGRPGMSVAVVDERSEIAGCYRGVPQNDVGQRTDVLDGCPKAEGMRMLLRSMAPKVIAVDEIGRQEDVWAIDEIINGGVKIVCTVHGKSLDDLRKRPVLNQLIEKGIFQRFVVLDKPGSVVGIYDEAHRSMMEGGVAHGN